MNENEWFVPVPQKLLNELFECFYLGPIIDDHENRDLFEHTIAILKGLKIEIFSNEHPPPHFRVTYNGKSANYKIKDCTKISGDLDIWDRNIRKWHKKNKDILIITWNTTRPSDCPVGNYRE